RMVIALPLPHGDLEAPVPPPRRFWPLAAVLLLAGFISLGWIPQSRPAAGGAISVAAQPAVEGAAVPSRHRQTGAIPSRTEDNDGDPDSADHSIPITPASPAS